MAEGARLESVYTFVAYRGFESHPHLHFLPHFYIGFVACRLRIFNTRRFSRLANEKICSKIKLFNQGLF